jgi:hypothetical protein
MMIESQNCSALSNFSFPIRQISELMLGTYFLAISCVTSSPRCVPKHAKDWHAGTMPARTFTLQDIPTSVARLPSSFQVLAPYLSGELSAPNVSGLLPCSSRSVYIPPWQEYGPRTKCLAYLLRSQGLPRVAWPVLRCPEDVTRGQSIWTAVFSGAGIESWGNDVPVLQKPFECVFNMTVILDW